MKRIRKFIIPGVILLVLVIVAASAFTIVQPGHVGVLLRLGAVQQGVLSEGFHMIVPFVTNVVQLSVRTAKAEVESSAASRDLQTIQATVAVNYAIDTQSASSLYKNVGLSYESVVVMPAIQESVKAATAQYSAEELITKRQDVSAKIKSELSDKLLNYGLRIEALNITGLDFSEEFNRAIEAKQTAQQQALKAEQDLTRIKIEAQQQVEQAKARAEATRAEADAQAYAIEKLQQQLQMSEQYIRYQTIQRWDGKLPIVSGDSGAILDLSSIMDASASAASAPASAPTPAPMPTPAVPEPEAPAE
jgi:regulator of protease activity HflC (stomatin/prohibitin superfamily)